ncbi:MAG: hypothetical protein K6C34_01355 [Alphaproteobacteria bacterium]|nr:hypothetical protein [Alphaproteobacteria bacterium]
MNNINELSIKDSDDIFIDEDGKPWRKLSSRDYVVIGKDELLTGTATLLFSYDHNCYRYADIECDIEAGEDEDETTAKILFEEYLEIHMEGKIYWAR